LTARKRIIGAVLFATLGTAEQHWDSFGESSDLFNSLVEWAIRSAHLRAPRGALTVEETAITRKPTRFQATLWRFNHRVLAIRISPMEVSSVPSQQKPPHVSQSVRCRRRRSISPVRLLATPNAC
jgi:hypothetical protein